MHESSSSATAEPNVAPEPGAGASARPRTGTWRCRRAAAAPTLFTASRTPRPAARATTRCPPPAPRTGPRRSTPRARRPATARAVARHCPASAHAATAERHGEIGRGSGRRARAGCRYRHRPTRGVRASRGGFGRESVRCREPDGPLPVQRRLAVSRRPGAADPAADAPAAGRGPPSRWPAAPTPASRARPPARGLRSSASVFRPSGIVALRRLIRDQRIDAAFCRSGHDALLYGACPPGCCRAGPC